MENTREIYWNVGHGVTPLMYLLAFAAMGYVVWSFWKRLSIWKRGRALNRFDHFWKRLFRLIGIDAGQVLVARTAPGKLHAIWFWAFAILFIGTLIVMAQADLLQPLFGIVIMKGTFYLWYSLVLDVAGVLALLALLGLGLRRFIMQPKGLETGVEDWLVHALLAGIILSGYLIEGLRMAATELGANEALAAWSPVGRLVAGGFAFATPRGLGIVHVLLWWFHFALVLGFIVSLPSSKLKHILTTGANAFFAPLEPKGTIDTINLEDEGITQYGAARVSDLTWKDIFDADACTKCARCQDACPAYSTGKSLSPMKVVADLGAAALKGAETTVCDAVGSEALWSCTTCRACQEACPAGVEQVNKIIAMRRNLALMEGDFPDEGSRKAAENLEVNGNPFGLAFASRGEWATGIPVIDATGKEAFDILYFAGCYASFDARNRRVARAFVESCAAAGVRVGILGSAEKCCGEPIRKLGNEYLYQALAAGNVEAIKASGATKIVTTCPHCFNTLARDYRDLGLELPVEHHATFLSTLIDSGRLPFKRADFECSYHDSCYIGRYMDIYKEPRKALTALGGRVREMKAHHADSFCCGGGGGRIFAEEKLGTRISVARADMAAATGAPLLVTNCPFCLTMLEDGVKTGGHEGHVQTQDLAELVAARLGLAPQQG
jgi:Fe-S oxidoreductase/nitrate reductase gamma subunit